MSKGGERTTGKTFSYPLGHGMPVSKVNTFYNPVLKLRRYTVSGVTKDSAGAVLGDCNVEVYETSDPQNRLVGATVSDADGNYSIDVNGPDTEMTFFAVANKAGAPDVAGTTVNTLPGIEI